MNLKSKILVSTATMALVMTGVTGAQAAQVEKPSRMALDPVSLSEQLEITSPPQITASTEAATDIAYVQLPPVTPKPVEVVPLQQPVAVQTPVAAQPAAVPQTYNQPATAPAAAAAPPQVAAAPLAVTVAAPLPAPVVSSGSGASLVASAYGQLGVAQDCTAMVENALRSIGLSVGDLAPGQFYGYGSVVGSPEPGDLVITSGHVAIYVGGGQVISGGFDGMNTVLHPLSYLSGASFVRVP